jgi:hypothetical protein
VVAFAVHGGAAAWPGYLLLAVVAYHLYDTMYRARYGVPQPPPSVEQAGLGHLGRALLVLALAVVAVGLQAVLPVGVLLVAGWVLGLFGAESVTAWYRWLRSRPRIEEDG